ncbi:MAG: hypothetical protein ACLFUS_14135 [Candidatus Sumerlaeia bacterium]
MLKSDSPSNAASSELTVNEALTLLFDYKWILLGFTLLVGIAAALYTLTLPNTYRSSSALIIREPEIGLTGEASPLTTEMLLALIQSTQIKRKTFDSLAPEINSLERNGVLEEGFSFRSFQKMLQTQVERQTGMEQSLIPLIKLSAEGPSPEFCASAANAWAQTVTSQTSQIYQSGIEEVAQFAEDIYREADEALNQSEERLTSAMLSAQVELQKSRLKESNQTYAKLYQDVLDLDAETSNLLSLIENEGEFLSAQEIDGVWMGELFNEEKFGPQIDIMVKQSETAKTINEVKRNIQSNQKRLAKFEMENNLQFVVMDLGQKEAELENILSQLMDTRGALAQAQATYEELSTQMKQEPQKITLNKAITNDVLWDSILNEVPQSDLMTKILKTEESNEVYLELRIQVAALAGNISGQKERIDNFEEQLNKLQKRVGELSQEETLLTARYDDLSSAIEKDKTMLRHLEEAYNLSRQNLEQLRQDYKMKMASLQAKKRQLTKLEKDIGTLENHVLQAQNKISSMRRIVENRTEVRETIASQREEVALLKIAAKQSSRSGAMLLYQAVPDPLRVSPHRSRIVLASMAAAFFLFAFLLVIIEIVRRTHVQRA